MKKSRLILLVFGFVCYQGIFSQDLLDLLEEEQQPVPAYSPSAFMMTRIAFGHSTEVRPQNVLEIMASNRFWNLPSDPSRGFIANKLNTRIALEYGLSDRLSLGFGGSTFDNLFDSYLKYRVALQSTDNGWPVTLTLFQNVSYDSSPIGDTTIPDGFSNRLSFTSQLLISKRFNKNLSLQLSPSLVNRSLGLTNEDPTTVFCPWSWGSL